jgi:hypothetical protein
MLRNPTETAVLLYLIQEIKRNVRSMIANMNQKETQIYVLM